MAVAEFVVVVVVLLPLPVSLLSATTRRWSHVAS
jgi:hypothetical protein